jgi:hypothetical protein
MLNLPTEMLLTLRHVALGSITLTTCNPIIWAGVLVAFGMAIFDRLSRSFQLQPLHKGVNSERLPLEVILRYQRGVDYRW